VNLHSIHFVECNEAWGACTSLCVIMLGACELITSRVLYGSSLCKNEPISDLHLVTAACLLNLARWALVVSFHRHHLFGRSYAFTWLFSLSWGTAAMSGFISQPLDHYTFWAVPPLPEPVATLYTTRSSRTSLLYALFWLVKNEKIAEYFSLFDSLKRIKMEVYFQLFSDRLKTKRSPSLPSWLVKRK